MMIYSRKYTFNKEIELTVYEIMILCSIEKKSSWKMVRTRKVLTIQQEIFKERLITFRFEIVRFEKDQWWERELFHQKKREEWRLTTTITFYQIALTHQIFSSQCHYLGLFWLKTPTLQYHRCDLQLIIIYQEELEMID